MSLIDIRRKLKRKKPKFLRDKYWKFKKLINKLKWKRPDGLHSKVRLRYRGRQKRVDEGYKSPKKVRGLHPSGLKEILVHNVKELEGLNKEEVIVRIARVGKKKKLEIFKKAQEMGLKVANPVKEK